MMFSLNNMTEDGRIRQSPSQKQTERERGGKALTAQSSSPETTSDTAPSSERHPPLRFVFSGYSLWLELEQRELDVDGRGDLDRALIDAADHFRLGGAIPSPHVTALYGFGDVEKEGEIRRLFRTNVNRVLLDEAEKRRKTMGESGTKDVSDSKKLWPDFAATGIKVDVEFDGLNGGTMDMAWAEVSLATSPEHETLIDALHAIFAHYSSAISKKHASSSTSEEEKKEEYVPRSRPWVPHLSICYDNPEGLGPNLCRLSIEEFMKEECPALLESDSFTRAVTGISLWRTIGTIDKWHCLDRLNLTVDE